MISCQFCKIFESTFFIGHLRWLLLAILKPLDSQRQLCIWISKLATIYFISTFCWYFCVYFWQAQAFLLHLDGPVVEEIWRFWFFTWPHNWIVMWLFGWGPIILIQHPTKFWGGGVTWYVTSCPLTLSHHTAKFGIHGSCESGNITFSICHVTMILKCDMTLWVASPHPNWLTH